MCHVCRAPGTLPWVAMHFWKRPGRKEARTEKELDGTGLLARSATKPIPVHDFGEWY